MALIAITALLVILAIRWEHASRAARNRQFAENRLHEGRLDEADEFAAIADNLVPGNPATANLIARLHAERRENLADEIDRGDMVRAWRDWRNLRPDEFAAARMFDQQTGLQPLRVLSELPNTRVTFHAQHPDGRPKEGPPLYALTAGPKQSPAEDLTRTQRVDRLVIPGTYWVTAFVEGTDAFVERPFEVKRDRTFEAFSHVLELFPKTIRDATAGMVEVPAGTLKMGSNKTPPRVGDFIQAPAEYPEHDVPVRSFYLDRTEVTNRAFVDFLSKTGRLAWGQSIWPETNGRPATAQLDYPLTRVKYAEAVEFAAWRGCCLPDEAQLEWAAHGPKSLSEPKNVPPDAPNQRWIDLHAVDSDPVDLTDHWSQPIRGLYGNAGELSLFRIRPYPNQVRSIVASTAWSGFAVRCGASYDSISAKPLSLGYIKRGSVVPDYRSAYVGFRCARPIAFRINVLSQPLSEE